MLIVVPKETHTGETRVPVIPETVAKLVQKGADIAVESGVGASIRQPDEAYAKAGAKVVSDRAELLASGDVVLRLRKPPLEEISRLKRGCIHVSFLDPFHERERVDALAKAGVSAISMEMIPRTTRAQKMDALSSQANLAGYVAVIIASERLDKILPMMMTPAGTISPSRVFVIGAGVAGLQAIATAKRLGARVEAFDTRPVVEEQVRSLGAKFVKVDLGETGQTKDGYAKELTPEQQHKQREAMAQVCAQADIVITTAQLFGRRAPLIITREMIARMKPGSVIVDLAVESGGNVEGSELDKEIDVNGVLVVGLANLPGRVAVHASQMYSANLAGLIEDFWDKEKKSFVLRLEDEIIKGCLVTHDGAVVNEMIKKAYGG
ncbi:MAG: NAD(P) transhydrogenase subunit alpha [Candidatus Hydrogenedentota bacterium]